MQVILFSQPLALNKWFLFFLFATLPLLPKAQMKMLVLGKCPDCYIQYKMNAAETPAKIAAWAGISIEQLLKLNQLHSAELALPTIKIPLNPQILLSEKSAMPVYHVVEKGDNLYRLNITYFKPGINKIKEWNQLKNETLKDGTVLLVGYLAVRQPLTSSVQDSVFTSSQLNTITAPTAVPSNANPTAGSLAASVASPSKEAPKNVPVPPSPAVTAAEGYFASQYKPATESSQLIALSGLAGVFKSITGFADQRFYVLINDIIPGTIVRISVDQVKYICAKVIGPVPDNKPNKGLMVRISNAAAEALGMGDAIFPVIVQFFE